MNALKILIVEDDSLIAEGLASDLENLGYSITDTVDSYKSAISSFSANIPDIVFLDVQIASKEDGIRTAEDLKKIQDIPIIFLTNFKDKETIVRAEKVNPSDYLAKPFNVHQLEVSIQRALLNNSQNVKHSKDFEGETTPIQLHDKDTIYLKDKGGSYNKYHISELLYIQAARTYSTIVLSNGANLLQTMPMSKTFQSIGHSDLVQVHKSYVVNLTKIDKIKGGGSLIIINDTEIPVSPTHKETLKKLLKLV